MSSPITIEFARRDDCLDQMVPSELRVLVTERDTLRTANQRLEGEVARLREALRGWLNLFPKQGVSGGPITIQKERTKSVLLSGEVRNEL